MSKTPSRCTSYSRLFSIVDYFSTLPRMPTQADHSSIDSIGSLLAWMLNPLINMILMHPGGGVSNYAPIIEVACWAHCRRKFFDVWEATKSPVAKEALDRIAAVYAIEDKARFAPAAERVEHRRETAPLLEKFFDWGKATVVKLSGKLELAKAFRYTIDRREALTRFVTDGRLEVDNNVAENAMRGIALGRKNYLFCGSDSGGERAASIYTLVATAKLNGLNPEVYLRDILAKIADGHTINRIDELLPWRMVLAAATSPP